MWSCISHASDRGLGAYPSRSRGGVDDQSTVGFLADDALGRYSGLGGDRTPPPLEGGNPASQPIAIVANSAGEHLHGQRDAPSSSNPASPGHPRVRHLSSNPAPSGHLRVQQNAAPSASATAQHVSSHQRTSTPQPAAASATGPADENDTNPIFPVTPRRVRRYTRRIERRTRNENPHRPTSYGNYWQTYPSINDPLSSPGWIDKDGNKQRRRKREKKTRANIKFGTLNMNGKGAANATHPDSKWMHLEQQIRTEELAILALQETHLTDADTATLNEFFKDKFTIFNSSAPDANKASSTMGIAIVINHARVVSSDPECFVIVPGRAILLRLNWANKTHLNILAIYAPASCTTEKKAFLAALLQTRWRPENADPDELTLPPRPDIMLGDFNLVEDAIDRLPHNSDENSIVGMLLDLKTELGLIDGWRRSNPDVLDYTFIGNNHQSRIDRIYLNKTFANLSFAWESKQPVLKSDHSLVATRLACPLGTTIGKNRWALPSCLKDDDMFKAQVEELGMKTMRDLEVLDASTSVDGERAARVQSLFRVLKGDIVELAKKRVKQQVSTIQQLIEKLEKEKSTITNDTSKSQTDRHIESKATSEKIAKFKLEKAQKQRLINQARFSLEGESLSTKYWTALNKAQKPRDTFQFLYKDNDTPREPPPPTTSASAATPTVTEPGQADGHTRPIERDSQKLTDIAGRYHANLQTIDDGLSQQETEDAANASINHLKKQLTIDEQVDMAKEITRDEVVAAIKASKSGVAPGIDGIGNEFWKMLVTRYEEHKKAEKPGFDIATLLTRVFCSIANHGVEENSDFSVSWMCPIYKKGDRADIANYRPISILNTDHKVLTKVLSIRLAKVAPNIIHQDQAGFMQGRLIYNQVHQTDLIVNAGKMLGINGAVIALDQEKAYDKLSHEYLWKVLDKVKIPGYFSTLVKNLYAPAKTTVVINGCQSQAYSVTRGVRQGCPLSCLLFNLGIEPLAAMIRDSPKLKGFNAKDENSSFGAKLSMYADDTTVYLDESDNFKDLDDILKLWCKGSKAKFNTNKTEILPFGSKDYRKSVTETRKLNPESQEFPPGAKIARDKESIRILGAWLGNETNLSAQWSTIVDTIAKKIDGWERLNPTLEGRRLIHQMEFGSRTQYRTAVQGMPDDIRTQLTRIQRNSTKKDGRHDVSLETLQLTFGQGGKNLIDIETRNEAIDLIRLKHYLSLENRPQWAYLADILMKRDVPKDQQKNPHTLISCFLQDWKPRKIQSNLPKILQDMLNSARKHNVRVEAYRESLTRSVVEDMPIWKHPFLKHDAPKSRDSNIVSKCLQRHHAIRTVKDALNASSRNAHHSHKNRPNCDCMACEEDRIDGCTHPNNCATYAIKLVDHLAAEWDPRNYPMQDQIHQNLEATSSDSEIFNKNPKAIKSTQGLYRAFGLERRGPENASNDQQSLNSHTSGITIRIPALNSRLLTSAKQTPQPVVQTTIAGWCKGNYEHAPAGIGLWYGPGDPRNAAIRVDEPRNDTKRTEILSVILSVQRNPKDMKLEIQLKSSELKKTLLKEHKELEETGWIGIENGDALSKAISLLRSRTAPTLITTTEESDPSMAEAATLAKQGAKLSPIRATAIDLALPRDEASQSGCKVEKLTQALAYKAIRNRRYAQRAQDHTRKGTRERLTAVQNAVKELTKKEPRPSTIFTALRSNALARNVKQFFYNAVHKAQKLGKWWENIPNCEERGTCRACNKEETLEHILMECTNSGQSTIWKLAGALLTKKSKKLLTPIDLGAILGAPLMSFKSAGQRRLFTIIISESAFLAWKFRNATVINGNDAPTDREIATSWIKRINSRLQQDCAATDKRRFKKKAIDAQLVMDTWRGTLQDPELNDKNSKPWTFRSGVLVGISLADAG